MLRSIAMAGGALHCLKDGLAVELEHAMTSPIPNATARVTVLDQSAVMLESAKQRLSRFGDRADTAQGDLRDLKWGSVLNGGYDVAVSSIAIHNLADADLIQAVYSQVHSVLAEDGCFF